MTNKELEHVFVNFSKRKIKIVDNEGYDKEVQWKWDFEGAKVLQRLSLNSDIVDPEIVTYLFAEQ